MSTTRKTPVLRRSLDEQATEARDRAAVKLLAVDIHNLHREARRQLRALGRGDILGEAPTPGGDIVIATAQHHTRRAVEQLSRASAALFGRGIFEGRS